MSTSSNFDAIIIGTGQAGPPLAVDLANAGWKVAIVERHLFGGTCVNTGCIPTKALIASARVAQMAKRAEEYGVFRGADVRVDMKIVKARKDEIAGVSNRGVEEWLRSTPNCTVFNGHAEFVSDAEVRVGNTTLEAKHIFINVGGRAAIPEIPGLEKIAYLTNSSMMEVDYLPEHLIIVGGGYVALEFAQMYRRFGSRVTILQRGPRLIEPEDEDVSAAMKEILEAEGIDIRLNAKHLSAGKNGTQPVITFAQDNESPASVEGSHLLLATGRQPNTDDLGLENTTIRRDQKGFIAVDDQLRTSTTGVWALGDCNGRGAFTHTSYNDYEIVSENLLKHGSRKVSDRIVTYAIFTDPPLGRVGMTQTQAIGLGHNVLVGTRPMTKVGRAFEKGETKGFIKIIVDAESQLILGASILGVEGDEAIHSIVDVMYSKVPYTVLRRAVHIHPTVAELIPTVLGSIKPLDEKR